MTELVNSESSNKKKIAMLTMCIGSEYQKKWKSAARSKEIGGTGLGLTIVKHILNKHRGHLDIKSEINQGSTFSVELPIAPIS